ncbi:MAG: hypothetical protein NT062_17410 [Proteobacteria bacterium]|nr:hypothetical protein [Pseudomonadota bacterium]
MGGCTNCSGKSGCDDRKGSMMEEVEHVLERVYPTHTWGEPSEAVLDLEPSDVDAIADELAQELAAQTFVERGGDAEPCDYIWVLCLGRAPCILAVRDHGAEVPDEWATSTVIDELYLRVCISHRARVAAVQQIAVTATRGDDGRFAITSSPRAGVYDAPLLRRMQKLVAILPAYDLLHVDFGEIAHAPIGFHAGAWRDLYGGEPAIANYLFFPQPTTMITTGVL